MSVFDSPELHDWNDLWVSEQLLSDSWLVLGIGEVKRHLAMKEAIAEDCRAYHPGEQVFVLPVVAMRCLIRQFHSSVSYIRATLKLWKS